MSIRRLVAIAAITVAASAGTVTPAVASFHNPYKPHLSHAQRVAFRHSHVKAHCGIVCHRRTFGG